ncbi:hypothetical protein [Cereibacter changlensis]|uniref:hypothetical protein n=1 Tax=Cereibacter changlensis TaxID=402884 RepID=UPI004034E562
MFFTKAGTVVAWIATVLGFVAVVTGYEVTIRGTGSLFADMLPIDTDRKAYLQAKTFVGQGAVMLACGIALGILTEISRSVSRTRAE